MKKLQDETDRIQRTFKVPNDDHSNEWVDPDNAAYHRNVRKIMVPDRINVSEGKDGEGRDLNYVEFVGVNSATGGMDDTYPLNTMPPGMFVENQIIPPKSDQIPHNEIGTDVTKTPSEDLARGFVPNQFSPTDEDPDKNPEFYGEAKGEDEAGNKVEGFLE